MIEFYKKFNEYCDIVAPYELAISNRPSMYECDVTITLSVYGKKGENMKAIYHYIFLEELDYPIDIIAFHLERMKEALDKHFETPFEDPKDEK